MQPVVVIGASLAGMAAAARLAKAGHPVVLCEATQRLGGRGAAYALDDGTVVDDLPPVITFPAPIRDLFRKSGRPLEAELARSRAELVPAPPADLVFADGSTLTWPSDRGDQYVALDQAYGTTVADSWRDLLDRLDEVWQVVRRLGFEQELRGKAQLPRAVRERLLHRQSLAELATAAGHPHLTVVLRSIAYRLGSVPEQTPAWCAAYASVERTFGRWRTATSDERDARTSVLVDALTARLATRKVDVRTATRVIAIEVGGGRIQGVQTDAGPIAAGAVIATPDPWRVLDGLLPRSTARRTRRAVHRLRPAQAPLITHRRGPPDGSHPAALERVELDESGCPRIVYSRPSGAVSVHDYRRTRPDPSFGVAWHGFADWLRRPPVTTEVTGLFIAGPASPGGGGLPAVVLSGALASYGVHDLLGDGR